MGVFTLTNVSFVVILSNKVPSTPGSSRPETERRTEKRVTGERDTYGIRSRDVSSSTKSDVPETYTISET